MSLRGPVFALLGLIAGCGPALADAIDGSWCKDSGGRLSIDGPAIVTPGGTALRGSYSRHAFSYTAPPGEPDAGATIEMRLLNEETMQMRASPDAVPQTWHRCAPSVS